MVYIIPNFLVLHICENFMKSYRCMKICIKMWMKTFKDCWVQVKHVFIHIYDHEIISTVILLPSTDLFKKGCCQLQAKVCAQITG